MQRAINSQENLEEQIWRTHTPEIKTSYKAKRIKSIRWCKKRKTNPWNKIKISDTDPRICGHLNYDKNATDVHGKRIVFSINGAGLIRFFYSYTAKLSHLLL